MEMNTSVRGLIIAAPIRVQRRFLFHLPARVYKVILPGSQTTSAIISNKNERNPHEAAF
jgi:hypothetical protein